MYKYLIFVFCFMFIGCTNRHIRCCETGLDCDGRRSNGCWQSGQLHETDGNIEKATYFYRMACGFNNNLWGAYIDKLKILSPNELESTRRGIIEFVYNNNSIIDDGFDKKGEIIRNVAKSYMTDRPLNVDISKSLYKYSCREGDREACKQLENVFSESVDWKELEVNEKLRIEKNQLVYMKFNESEARRQEIAERSWQKFVKEQQQDLKNILLFVGAVAQGVQQGLGNRGYSSTGNLDNSNNGNNSACSQCTSRCKGYGKGMADLYREAACLCQCNYDAGGCGSSRSFLLQCVRENNANAMKLNSSAPSIR
ncbi:hypothetical protein HXX01_03650 [Candidatus Nomurabacteria bacterium]|nr:hypothetical protein [Candidatus Nomurabacteria bacterium]